MTTLSFCRWHPDNPVVSGTKACTTCQDYFATRYATIKASGMCPGHPSVPVVSGKALCQSCLDRLKESRLNANKKGMCQRHSNRKTASTNSVLCQECITDFKQKRIARKQAGMCQIHGHVPAAPGKTICEKCLAGALDRKRQLKLLVFSHYGFRCACRNCPYPEPGLAFLTIDHVNNDGNAHRRTIRVTIYQWLKNNNFPDGFQTLCYNCNMAKGKCGGVCPHEESIE